MNKVMTAFRAHLDTATGTMSPKTSLPFLLPPAGALLAIMVLRAVTASQCLAGQTNLVVAADGTGQFKTVQEAVMAIPAGSADSPVFIHIKPGTYKELIYIQREKPFFHLVGDGPGKAVLTYDLNARMPGHDGKPMGTFRTASTVIDADDFTAENVTFENSAGPVGQALAIRIEGDRVAFRNCRFRGWQDTILDNRGRHYYQGCYIAGHVDFIFGSGTAFFDRCHIHCLGKGYITAASTPEDQPFGFVFSNCEITVENPEVRTYLGRPWRNFASTIFLNTRIAEGVQPEGWNNWKKPEAERTARYAEFNSTGPGANPKARVPWARQLTSRDAEAITVKSVLGGADGWNPARQESAETNAVAFGSEETSPGNVMKTDIEYGKADGESLRLDVSIPEGRGPFPVAIIVHGGGWSSGDKQRNITPLFEPLTKANFTWFSINYRLAPANRWPACFEDVQAAIRWVKAHAADYRGDPRRIALIGYSAGGQLVCQAVALAKDDTRVQAVVGFAPPSDLVADTERRGGLSKSLQALLDRDTVDESTRTLLKGISPINHVRPGLPPFLLLHGDADKSVPHEQSLDFQSRLKANGVACELVTVKGAPHRLEDWDKFDPTYSDKMIAWLQHILSQ
jgi:pectinesterase